MKHFNNHRPCVVLTKRNGSNPIADDLVEVVFIPLTDGLRQSEFKEICAMTLRPRKQGKLHRAEYEHAMKYGLDPITAMELFDKWYNNLQLRFNKRILPITYNWPAQYGFLQEWIGYDSENQPIIGDYIADLYRDILPISLYWSELADLNDLVPPFHTPALTRIGTRLGVIKPKSKSLLDRAFFLLETYDRLMSLRVDAVDLPMAYPSEIDYSLSKEEDLPFEELQALLLPDSE